jgi:hypothetical protein
MRLKTRFALVWWQPTDFILDEAKKRLRYKKLKEVNMGVWQEVAMDSLNLHPGLPCHVSGVACQQGRRPAAVFYPLGHPTPYAHGSQKKPGEAGEALSLTLRIFHFLVEINSFLR